MKINLTLSIVAAVCSAAASLGSALWFGSSRSSDIDHLKVDVDMVLESDRQQGNTLSRLDERTGLILESVRRLEQRP
ncbi:hypothetical protein UFOVP806_33 [uncultured Caudovirales phage]|uniref:Uncharacterized protein n=1 Tax=uncultured Caudovirales phage TaxID=2100421 RepID=A0A6J5NXV1_9CAUD|nr:hypothetical protein UFOVP806_33 [uncultured Caudovirales phage]